MPRVGFNAANLENRWMIPPFEGGSSAPAFTVAPATDQLSVTSACPERSRNVLRLSVLCVNSLLPAQPSPKSPAPLPSPSVPDPPPAPRTKGIPHRKGMPESTPASSAPAIHARETTAPKIRSHPDTRQTNTNSARQIPSPAPRPPPASASARTRHSQSPAPAAARQSQFPNRAHRTSAAA